ncbi:MAG: pyridoxal kinase [Alphaproteobacteria bacterium]|nr:pyridoxal kinase [Alphaproteobacteria bacterium]MBU0796435.1 pyridoxal kinase [Alphaproteobacteria bacterium]MBU0888679.1 pyridoxal kinase [Alphaproteobacteria bacterium]MBU1813587.1 pyridoxal kinase [Alphaproteobacteria bacterium]
MNVLSIQSAVAYGHVGNSAAQPALNQLGHEIWRVDTVGFSNHPGHGAFTGIVRPAQEIADLLRGLAGLGVFEECHAVLSGYLGEPGTAAAVVAAVTAVKQANRHALYLLDPVMGDAGRIYVRDGVPAAMEKTLLPLADIVTPNAFELSLLAGRPVTDEATAVDAAQALLAIGPSLVIVTGLRLGAEEIATLAITRAGAWSVRARLVDRAIYGTGDLLSALLLGHRLNGANDPARALALAASGLAEAVSATEALAIRTGSPATGPAELALVPALERICRPPDLLPVTILL